MTTVDVTHVTNSVTVERDANTVTVERSGLQGPNAVSTSTSTSITGLLKGAAGFVAQAVADTDYQSVMWSRFTDESMAFIKPATSTDRLLIGNVSDVTPYNPVHTSSALFIANSETNYFSNIAVGTSSFLNAGGLFIGARSQGTLAAPTAIAASYGLGGLAFLGHDGTSFSTGGDSVVIPGLYVYGDIVGTGNVRQTWDIVGGVGGTSHGVIKVRTDNRLSFFRTATPAAQNTGWTVSGAYTPTKTFDATSATLATVRQVLGTLVDALKTYGLIGA